MNTIIYEMTENGKAPIDVFQKLLNDRIIFVVGIIDDDMASDISALLMLKDAESSDSKITLLINSRGGDVRNVLTIYDIMKTIKCPIETIVSGSAFKEATILAAAGTQGMRMATANSTISFAQLSNYYSQMSNLTEAQIALNQVEKDNKKMMGIIASLTGKPIKQVTTDFSRSVFMSPKEAIKYGLIDKVV